MESIIVMILAVAIIPANIWAIYRFHRKKLNKAFLSLVTLLCICNLAMSVIAIISGLARTMDQHPLGKAGCTISMTGLCGITTVTMMVQAIISYERRKVITKIAINQFSYRVYLSLVVSVIFGMVFWILYFVPFEGLAYISVRTDANSTNTIEICCTSSFGFLSLPEIIFTSVAFFIPTITILYNYWPIWKQALNRSSSSRNKAATSVQNVQMRLALIMSLTVLEFFIFQLPFSAMVLTTIFQKLSGSLTMQTDVSAICFSLWFIDSIINPLWTTFLSNNKTRKVDNLPIESSWQNSKRNSISKH